MKSDSLTSQAAFLIIGRLFSIPIAFLVPVVLARILSLDEFGYYKQLFLIFNICLPLVDFGITNSLYYFLPTYPNIKNKIIWQSITISFCICLILLLFVFIYPEYISVFFTGKKEISNLVFYVVCFAVMWHFSNLLEVVLITEKRAFFSSVITFFSELSRSLVSVGVVFFGGRLRDLLISLCAVAFLRIGFMLYYVIKKYQPYFVFHKELVKKQILYAVPFGIAVAINGFNSNAHTYIVSILTDPASLAIFTIGCFQIPLISIAVDSVAKASIVKMSEIKVCGEANLAIARIVSSSSRKLFVVFLYIYILFYVNAKEVIYLLFTDAYAESVPVLKIFLLIVPLSSFLIQHVPRVLDDTVFILLNNCVYLIVSLISGFVFFYLFGLNGVACSFVVSQIIWKIAFYIRCKNKLSVNYNDIINYKELTKIMIFFFFGAIVAYCSKFLFVEIGYFYSILISTCSFSVYCLIGFFAANIFIFERELIIKIINLFFGSLKKVFNY
ncbi:lipopolysaccharide biosynthesis protein [Desulfogranum japonicum]|uniref:lipopolysaccharide biosynthesis protein n=1 Tax=Desulfogranum japonicum TaxID=231447 RepID=UPI000429A473|nr:oligosaccharide flippase family protein [Desulfogranum japonicum]